VRRRDAVLFLFAAYACAHFLTMRLPWDILKSPIRGSDLSSYYTAGRLVREGKAASLYAVAPGDSILGDATSGPYREAGDAAGVTRQHYYIYPPLFALLFIPLGYLSFPAALDLWLGIDLLLLGLFMALYVEVRGDEMTLGEVAFMIGISCFEFLPLIWAMAVGQTSLIVLVLLTATLLLWKRGRDVAAGVVLGLAVAIKLTPALLSLFFWWRGRRKIAFASAIVFAATQAVSIAVLGWGVHREFFLNVVPSMAGGTCYFLNQSLGAFFNRLLTHGDVREVQLVQSGAARLLSLAAGLLLLVICAPALRRAARDSVLSDEIQFGVVLLLTLVLSPISWSHHYLLALLPILSLAGSLGRRTPPPVPGAVVLGVAYLLIARKPHPDLFLHGPARLLDSGALAGALLLIGLSLHALRGGESKAAPS
jgi:hypothetical protein